jgi:hypothetical protein
MSEACSNPICRNLIEPEEESRWRRTPKKYCCDGCRRDGWAIRRAAKLLSSLPAKRIKEILMGNRLETNVDIQQPINGKSIAIDDQNRRE